MPVSCCSPTHQPVEPDRQLSHTELAAFASSSTRQPTGVATTLLYCSAAQGPGRRLRRTRSKRTRTDSFQGLAFGICQPCGIPTTPSVRVSKDCYSRYDSSHVCQVQLNSATLPHLTLQFELRFNLWLHLCCHSRRAGGNLAQNQEANTCITIQTTTTLLFVAVACWVVKSYA